MDSNHVAKKFFADMSEGWIRERENQLRRKCEELLESNGYKPGIFHYCCLKIKGWLDALSDKEIVPADPCIRLGW
jgi:hypothetical protein